MGCDRDRRRPSLARYNAVAEYAFPGFGSSQRVLTKRREARENLAQGGAKRSPGSRIYRRSARVSSGRVRNRCVDNRITKR